MERAEVILSEIDERMRFIMAFYKNPPKIKNDTWWLWDLDGYQEICDSNGDTVLDNTGEVIEAHAGGYVDSHISINM